MSILSERRKLPITSQSLLGDSQNVASNGQVRFRPVTSSAAISELHRKICRSSGASAFLRFPRRL
ncbi:hypothetical protein D3M70_09550 [Pseudomonas sp. LS-2]|nr:hypothetical protein D3M70_09550 [Pseudomonas sp. LS-2]